MVTADSPSAFAENAAHYEADVGGAFAQTTHEVGEPFTPEWNVDADEVPFAVQGGLEVATNSIQHLKLEAGPIDSVFRRIGLCGRDHRLVMRRYGWIGATREQQAHYPDKRRVHVCFRLIRGVFRLLVGSLYEAYAGTQRIHPRRVRFAARQARLEHDTRVAVTLLPHRLEHVERHRGERRVLHVDANEEVPGARRVENPAQVVDARGAIDRQTELCELEGDVPLDTGCGNAVEDREVCARRGIRFRDRRHAFAEEVECHQQAVALDGARGLDRFLDPLAGNEAPRESVIAAHAVARRERLESLAAGENVEESFGNGLQHQWVRSGRRGASRCWSVRA